MNKLPEFVVTAEEANATVAAVLRPRLPGHSWSQIRTLISSRRVRVRGELCLDPARRVKAGDTVELLASPQPRPVLPDDLVIRHLDTHVVVVEKPSGVSTVRHPLERAWDEERKALSPTMEDLLARQIARRVGQRIPRLRIVHRLDKETSGLVVFARTVLAERGLGQQFRAHTVVRRYLALVQGLPQSQTIQTSLVRDRGDGRRGSTNLPGVGKEAITHMEVLEPLGQFSLVQCRLETGRTHQIRIHLSEAGHPVCGEKVYCQQRDGTRVPDTSSAPRLALHAVELGFIHPVTEEALHWQMPLPRDLQLLLDRLREQHRKGPAAHGDRDQVDH
ncbi:MAG: RluA family pseudouridine synthase [Gemmataceae bacterium]